MDLDGSRIVIIGGTSGIGRAVARRVGAAGASVVVASSSTAKVEQAREDLGDAALVSVLDVRDEQSVADFFTDLGPIDHVVHTAGDWGTMGRGRLADLDLDAAREAFTVRFWGALNVAKHAHPHIAPGGSITLTDGMVAHRPRAGSAVTSAMAGAVEHLVRALSIDLAPVRVNAVCPGLISTEALASIPAAQIETMTKRQAVPRAGSPDEAAEAYLYLMRGTYTTGQVLRVDGGMGLA